MRKLTKFDEWGKHQDYMNKIKKYCKCGHTVYVPKRNVFIYCNWCNRRVFQNNRCEFEYNLLRTLGKVNNEQIKK